MTKPIYELKEQFYGYDHLIVTSHVIGPCVCLDTRGRNDLKEARVYEVRISTSFASVSVPTIVRTINVLSTRFPVLSRSCYPSTYISRVHVVLEWSSYRYLLQAAACSVVRYVYVRSSCQRRCVASCCLHDRNLPPGVWVFLFPTLLPSVPDFSS